MTRIELCPPSAGSSTGWNTWPRNNFSWEITRFGGPEVLNVADVPEPTPDTGQKLYDVSTAGVNFADTHHALSSELT